MLLDPLPVGVQRIDQRLEVKHEIEGPCRGQKVDFADCLRQIRDCHRFNHQRHEALVRGLDLAKLPIAGLGGNEGRTHQRNHRVRARYEIGQFLEPLLAVGQVAPVDGDLEALAVERLHQPVRDLHVAPGVGDKHTDRAGIGVLGAHRRKCPAKSAAIYINAAQLSFAGMAV